MPDSDKIPRLSRLTSILLKLQSSSFVNTKKLAAYFGVSTRTIYRDLIALEAAGVPIVLEEGRGYSLMEGYNIPPVMFTEAEANALIIAEQMIAKTKDESLIEEFNKATDKVKAVLKSAEKRKANFLGQRIIIGKNWNYSRTSAYLTEIKKALTSFSLLKIKYRKENATEATSRQVEPFALYHNQDENWVLIAWCRLRKDFRNFRLDRIVHLQTLNEKFSPHEMTLDEYVEIQRIKHFSKSAT